MEATGSSGWRCGDSDCTARPVRSGAVASGGGGGSWRRPGAEARRGRLLAALSAPDDRRRVGRRKDGAVAELGSGRRDGELRHGHW
jgi:hypothetical protein